MEKYISKTNMLATVTKLCTFICLTCLFLLKMPKLTFIPFYSTDLYVFKINSYAVCVRIKESVIQRNRKHAYIFLWCVHRCSYACIKPFPVLF